MDCRGDAKRSYIVENYTVTPTAHIKLLKGKSLPSDAGGDITDTYFLFRCVGKSEQGMETICCGRPTAKKLCTMIDKEMPPLFNPLRSVEEYNDARAENIELPVAVTIRTTWNPEKKQLYNAVMLIISAWNCRPETPLFKIAERLREHIDYYPYKGDLKAVNTILTHASTTMDEIIEALKEKGNDLKDFSFDLVVNHLVHLGIQQHFCKTE